MVKRALIIGINYVNTPQARLQGCINDAIVIHNMLIDAYGYDKSNITVLRDDEAPGYKMPTRANIITELQNLMKISSPTDEIWFHYSGHGSYLQDRNNDESDRRDEMIIPCDYINGNIIIDDELRIILNSSKSLIYITLDACHSGTGCDLPYLYRNYNNRIYRLTQNKPLQNTRIFMLSAARDEQTANDEYNIDNAEYNGAFTNALVECLRFHNHNVDLITLLNDINSYFKTRDVTQRCELTSSSTAPYNVRITRTNIIQDNKKLTSQIIQNNMRKMII